MENKQQYAAVFAAVNAEPPKPDMLRNALEQAQFPSQQLSSLLPTLMRHYGSSSYDDANAAALRLLLQHGADPEWYDEKGLNAYDHLEKVLNKAPTYAAAEYLRMLWRLMQSEGPMPVFGGVLAWTTPDFHDAYLAERTALKKAEGFSLFGRKQSAPVERYFTAQNFYYRYDEECRCYLLYERSSNKLAGGRGDIPKKYKNIAIAESWRG